MIILIGILVSLNINFNAYRQYANGVLYEVLFGDKYAEMKIFNFRKSEIYVPCDTTILYSPYVSINEFSQKPKIAFGLATSNFPISISTYINVRRIKSQDSCIIKFRFSRRKDMCNYLFKTDYITDDGFKKISKEGLNGLTYLIKSDEYLENAIITYADVSGE
jgi:hypothetical protein